MSLIPYLTGQAVVDFFDWSFHFTKNLLGKMYFFTFLPILDLRVNMFQMV